MFSKGIAHGNSYPLPALRAARFHGITRLRAKPPSQQRICAKRGRAGAGCKPEDHEGWPDVTQTIEDVEIDYQSVSVPK